MRRGERTPYDARGHVEPDARSRRNGVAVVTNLRLEETRVLIFAFDNFWLGHWVGASIWHPCSPSVEVQCGY